MISSSSGYDLYDLYDLGEFDQKGSVRTKYGTKEEYIDAIHAVKEAGLQVYTDIVLNHMGGGDETKRIKVKKVNPENRNEFISDEFEIFFLYSAFLYSALRITLRRIAINAITRRMWMIPPA